MPGPGLSAETTWVLVATYQRPALLTALLDSLRGVQMSPGSSLNAPQLIVVDNAPEPEAQQLVTAHYPGARFLHQRQPGIASARNAALDALPESAEAVIFVDDDERVEPDWFTALLDCAGQSGADAVGGPVIPEFDGGRPGWAETYGYVRRTDRPTGPGPRRLATNNTLVRAEWFTEAGFRFDTAFNFSGGSDSDLFDRIFDAGGRFWWCAEARVHESVPPSRATQHWLRQRAARGGAVRAKKHRRRQGDSLGVTARIAVEGVARMAYGAARRTAARARRRPIMYTDDYYLCEGLGMLRSLSGRGRDEYARSSPDA